MIPCYLLDITYNSAEISAACRSLMESRGISGFWLGWTPTILRDVPFSGDRSEILNLLTKYSLDFANIYLQLQPYTGAHMKL